jgi:hypothetical protein
LRPRFRDVTPATGLLALVLRKTSAAAIVAIVLESFWLIGSLAQSSDCRSSTTSLPDGEPAGFASREIPRTGAVPLDYPEKFKRVRKGWRSFPSPGRLASQLRPRRRATMG